MGHPSNRQELVRLSQGESVADGGYNAKVDCWACGCIVYELLCGAASGS